MITQLEMVKIQYSFDFILLLVAFAAKHHFYSLLFYLYLPFVGYCDSTIFVFICWLLSLPTTFSSCCQQSKFQYTFITFVGCFRCQPLLPFCIYGVYLVPLTLYHFPILIWLFLSAAFATNISPGLFKCVLSWWCTEIQSIAFATNWWVFWPSCRSAVLLVPCLEVIFAWLVRPEFVQPIFKGINAGGTYGFFWEVIPRTDHSLAEEMGP